MRIGVCSTYSCLHDLDGRFKQSDLALGQIDRLAVGRGDELVLHDGVLVASILGRWEVGFGGNSRPVRFL